MYSLARCLACSTAALGKKMAYVASAFQYDILTPIIFAFSFLEERFKR